jgi:hypothetical protein
MLLFHWCKPLVAAMVVVALSLPARSQEVRLEEGYTSLFNGKDLTGWVYGKTRTGENKSGAGYAVENGALFCTVRDGGNLFTEKEYADFSFRFEFKLTENANNGIGIRAPLEGDAAYVGMEIQVLDDSGSNNKNLRPEQYHGAIYNLVGVKRGSQKPVGEWNSQEIEAKGTRIKVTLNGAVILDTDLADLKDPALLRRHPGIKNTKGHVGFLGHGARVEFRNMRIKEL